MILNVVACLFEFFRKATSVQKCVPCLGKRGLGERKLEFDSNIRISEVFRILPVQYRQRSRLIPLIQPETSHKILATWRREWHGGLKFLFRSQGEQNQWGATRQAGDSSRLLIDWNLMFLFRPSRYTIRSKTKSLSSGFPWQMHFFKIDRNWKIIHHHHRLNVDSHEHTSFAQAICSLFRRWC